MLRFQREVGGLTNLRLAGPDNHRKALVERSHGLSKAVCNACITSVDFPIGTALQARLYMRQLHVGETATLKLKLQFSLFKI